MRPSINQRLEANILSQRWGVNPRFVLRWMQARGFQSVRGLMAFSLDHQEAMDLALLDFWEFST